MKPFLVTGYDESTNFNGEVTFINIRPADKIRIGVRKTQLSYGTPLENLDPETRGLVNVFATLEFVITKAPKGFYTTVDEKPYLDISVLPEKLLYEVFDDWLKQTNPELFDIITPNAPTPNTDADTLELES